jgi:hypothetical protein
MSKNKNMDYKILRKQVIITILVQYSSIFTGPKMIRKSKRPLLRMFLEGDELKAIVSKEFIHEPKSFSEVYEIEFLISNKEEFYSDNINQEILDFSYNSLLDFIAEQGLPDFIEEFDLEGVEYFQVQKVMRRNVV